MTHDTTASWKSQFYFKNQNNCTGISMLCVFSFLIIIYVFFIVDCRQVILFDGIRFFYKVPFTNSFLKLTLLDNNTSNKKTTQQWFQKRFKYNKNNVSKSFTNTPFLVTIDTDMLNKRVDWLKNSLVLTDTQLGKMVQKQPKILFFISKNILEPKLKYLKGWLQWNNAEL